MIVYVYEYGKNEFIEMFDTEQPVSYATGDFFIRDTNFDNYKENMYIIRAVSHLMPSETANEPQVAIHVAKYDADAVQAQVDKVKDIMDMLNKKGKYEQKETEEKNS